MKKSVLFLNILAMLFFFVASAKGVMAGPHLIMSPSAGNYSINETFTVTIKIDSGTQVVYGADGVGTYDSTKLELVSMTKASPMAFDAIEGGGDCSPANISEIGKFDFSCYPNDLLEAKAVKGDLMVITFKTKAAGTAVASFTCAAGSSIDSNIVDTSYNDSIVCAENVPGSYVISLNETTVTPTITPIVTTTLTTTPTITATLTPTSTTSNLTTATPTSVASATELPQTGGIASTVGLIVFGTISLISALFLKFL